MILSNVKFLMKFENNSLLEESNQIHMLPVGDSKVSFDDGYQMKYNQYLEGDGSSSGGFSLNITNFFVIGFWLKPKNLGITQSGSNEISDIIVPVLDFVDLISPDDKIISINENSSYNKYNNINVSLNNGDYISSSSNYVTDLWHYFWIVYDYTNPSIGGSLKIYIDGVEDVSVETGVLPESLNANQLDVFVNKLVDGYDFNKTNNNGIIDDIIIFNSLLNVEEKMEKVINSSVDYISDSDYSYIEDTNFPVFFNDPPTVKVNSLIDDMSYVYLARNDGKILKGSPLLWESRKDFSDIKEKNILNESGSSEIENGFLTIKDSIIRF